MFDNVTDGTKMMLLYQKQLTLSRFLAVAAVGGCGQEYA